MPEEHPKKTAREMGNRIYKLVLNPAIEQTGGKYDALLQVVRDLLLTNTEALAILARIPELKDVEEVKDYVRNQPYNCKNCGVQESEQARFSCRSCGGSFCAASVPGSEVPQVLAFIQMQGIAEEKKKEEEEMGGAPSNNQGVEVEEGEEEVDASSQNQAAGVVEGHRLQINRDLLNIAGTPSRP